MIERIRKVPLREVWKDEAKDFTEWLERNIEVLGEEINLSLNVVKREREIGPFSADLVAEDSNGERVIIENQLEKTDHDHLGKIITYISNLDAKVAIWISSKPRPEHIKAIDWLNESASDIRFYLVKVEAYRIGDSEPAPKFSIICSPSKTAKIIGEEKEKWTKRHYLRLEFWKKLLEKCKAKTNLYSNISPARYSWIGTGAGISGLTYTYGITQKWGSAELYIDKGKGSKKLNKKIFDKLYSVKRKIEADFGEKLEWERLDDRRASRVRKKFAGVGLRDKDNWDKLQDGMINAMIRLETALKKHIRDLK